MTCVIEDCEVTHHLARGLCWSHYKAAHRAGTLDQYPRMNAEFDGWVNPLVCVCEEPDARADRDFGECAICRRKPLSLMTRPS